jgi:hypothetical protein
VQQETAHLRWFPIQHLGPEVLHQPDVVARQLRRRCGRIVPVAQGHREQPDPGRPALRAVHQDAQDVVAVVDPHPDQDVAGLLRRKCEPVRS